MRRVRDGPPRPWLNRYVCRVCSWAERRPALYRGGNLVYASDRGSVRRDRREGSGTPPFFGGLLAKAVAAKPRAFDRVPARELSSRRLNKSPSVTSAAFSAR